mmetsp:Transcript_43150/g.138797  ORF Transcript_43150/g.138797 Transcript_43150/m.138797 type:complete len:537 (+) Transcript_43150:106-1716(+)|eukprot:CAMPEP_0203841376 /NCGR_PEP_ID=MMETSP0359-20131031/1349_1 /ASSEMBLY_ACC=CAM_ASM_000338 /TAXON_ID=268821 /ORGANISM="Scrippsiella Hangoei, Strain SHTV-5" /LENGTH=536 /DNA_ID=CAMNT_0050755775 /DNA_START=82 /DNA_END=1692 /DNA_ORIENTATION=+
MAEYAEIRALPHPRRFAELTPEAQHYKSFRTLWKQKETSRVVALAFSPAKPHRLAVVSGTKVGIWTAGKAGSAEASSSISKFKDLTQCVAWRSDGKLMLAGEAGGSCAVVETENRQVLRRFRGHGDAVTCCSFAAADRSKAATGGRDGKLRIWDVATSELVRTVDAHSDCMKVLTPGPGGPDVWITAGYDGKVRFWDLRLGGGEESALAASMAVATVDHGSPVESGAAFPGGALFASAGGTEVKLWDLASGGRIVQTLGDAHSKVVTSVCLDASASVLLTASFDGFAKVYRAAGLEHLWTYKLPGPATCAAWRPDGKAFAVGLDDGQWQMRQWKSPAGDKGEDGTAVQAEDRLSGWGGPSATPKAAPKRGAYNKTDGHMRGMDAAPASDDEVVEPERPFKKRESQLDFFLRKFEYRKALEYIVTTQSFSQQVGLAAIEELLQRGALETTLTEIGDTLCLSVLRWLMKVFGGTDTLQQQLFMEALHTLLDCNKCLQPPSTAELLEAVERLENKVTQELKIQEVLMETGGMLKAVTTL